MEARFSGHETFSLRYGWLYKSANFLNKKIKISTSNNEDVESAVVELGVGKNMVSAIRYWSEVSAIVETKKNGASQKLTAIGRYLFLDGDNSGLVNVGRDPYLEKNGSIWLLHFLLNFNEQELTSYRYFFNFSSIQNFEKDKLIQDLEHDINVYCDKEVKLSTVKKDIDCFLNTYSSKSSLAVKKAKTISEDYFTSPLAELGLIKDTGKNFYVSLLDERPSLPTPIFVYALVRFIVETKGAETAGFDSILSDQNSPGKIFRLSEKGLGNQLDSAVVYYPKLLSIIDTQGMRQVRLNKSYETGQHFFEILDSYYGEKN